jgi:Holliday junction resolvasome RuvABC ATP-dependent DNA helicase subunit
VVTSSRAHGLIDTYLLDLESTLQFSERRATNLDNALTPDKVKQIVEASRALKKEAERLVRSMRDARELVRELRTACEELRRTRG